MFFFYCSTAIVFLYMFTEAGFTVRISSRNRCFIQAHREIILNLDNISYSLISYIYNTLSLFYDNFNESTSPLIFCQLVEYHCHCRFYPQISKHILLSSYQSYALEIIKEAHTTQSVILTVYFFFLRHSA